MSKCLAAMLSLRTAGGGEVLNIRLLDVYRDPKRRIFYEVVQAREFQGPFYFLYLFVSSFSLSRMFHFYLVKYRPKAGG